MRESVAVVVPHSRSAWPLLTRSSRVVGRNPLHGERLDLELLLQAGDDALAQLDRIPRGLAAVLEGERQGVGAVGDGDRLAVVDTLEGPVSRLGVRYRREQNR